MQSSRLIAAILGTALMVTGMAALAQHGPESSKTIAGEWAITFTIAGQTASGTMTFQQDGSGLTGNIETHHTGPGKLENLKWEKGKLSATCVFEKHESIALQGELKDGKLSGTFQTEGRDGTWEATRPTGEAHLSMLN